MSAIMSRDVPEVLSGGLAFDWIDDAGTVSGAVGVPSGAAAGAAAGGGCSRAGVFTLSSDFLLASILLLLALSIKSLKDMSCFVAHAAPSKSLSLMAVAFCIARPAVGALPPCVRSQTSRS